MTELIRISPDGDSVRVSVVAGKASTRHISGFALPSDVDSLVTLLSAIQRTLVTAQIDDPSKAIIAQVLAGAFTELEITPYHDGYALTHRNPQAVSRDPNQVLYEFLANLEFRDRTSAENAKNVMHWMFEQLNTHLVSRGTGLRSAP